MSSKKMQKLLRRVSWYPPYLGAGIKLKKYNKDFTCFEVELKMRWFNKNLFGTHFGGSLYAMSDPFFVFIVLNYLGQEYVIWDKSAKIIFMKPGKGTVKGVFKIKKSRLQEIKEEINIIGKNTYIFTGEIKNSANEIVAKVEKEIYIRKKDYNSFL